MNLVQSSQITPISLFLKEFFLLHSSKLLSSLFWKNHLYPLTISTTFVQFQTSTLFPKFSKKLLPPLTPIKIHNDLIHAMDRGEITSFNLHDISAAFDTVDHSIRLTSFNFHDLSAAFDTVNHSILITRLQNWFCLGGLSDWLSSYLSFRSHAVSIKDSSSAFSTLSCDVPKVPYLVYCFSLSIQLLLARWSQKIPSDIICTLMTPSCTTCTSLSLLSPLSLKFSLRWIWTNCSSIHQKLNIFLFAQNKNVSNFLI